MENQNSSTVRWVSISIIAAAIIISGTIIYTEKNPGSTGNVAGNNNQQPTQQQTADISKVNLTGEPFVGNANAPVVVAFWSDYQCPFCKKSAQESLTPMIADYVASGKVKIIYKDFVFLGSDSSAAALAARAVWEVAPDKFEQWHEGMFSKQDDENAGWGNKADILALTKSLGIDSAKVDSLMTSKASQYQAAIDADK